MRRQPELFEHFPGPRAFHRMKELRRRRIGKLDALRTRETPIEPIWNHQERVRCRKHFRTGTMMREPLIERVDLHELRTGVRKDFVAGETLQCRLETSARPRVAIAKWPAEHLA